MKYSIYHEDNEGLKDPNYPKASQPSTSFAKPEQHCQHQSSFNNSGPNLIGNKEDHRVNLQASPGRISHSDPVNIAQLSLSQKKGDQEMKDDQFKLITPTRKQETSSMMPAGRRNASKEKKY